MFTCCSISNALLSPSFSSLSGDGKLRKEETSGGRGADTGVDNYEGKEETKESQLTSTILFFTYFLALIGLLLILCASHVDENRKKKKNRNTKTHIYKSSWCSI